MTEMLLIQVSTLNEIIDALNASKFVTVRIRMSPLNDEENIISRKILEKVADEIRECDGTTEKIPINELATRITNIVRKIQLATPIIAMYDDDIFIKPEQLATPIIALYDDDVLIEPDSPPAENNTSAVLGVAILGMAILGSGSDGGATDELKREQLETTIITLCGDYGSRVEQLETTIIALYDETVSRLATPVIYFDVS